MADRLHLYRINPPSWNPGEAVKFSPELPPENREKLLAHQTTLLEVVHLALEDYLQPEAGLSSSGEPEDDWFPNRARLTGAYYISEIEFLSADEAHFPLRVLARFLETPSRQEQVDVDYLSLEVWLKYTKDPVSFEVGQIDSAAL